MEANNMVRVDAVLGAHPTCQMIPRARRALAQSLARRTSPGPTVRSHLDATGPRTGSPPTLHAPDYAIRIYISTKSAPNP